MQNMMAYGISFQKKDGECCHPNCTQRLDFKYHDKPPAGWAGITLTRYSTKGGSTASLLLCPKHTIAFTERQPLLKPKTKSLVRTVLESPFFGEESLFFGDIARNLMYIRAIMRDSLLRGESPFPSHALYTQGVLDDKKADERSLGLNASFSWGEVAQKIVVYEDLGYSKGMETGIEHANQRGQIIEKRRLGGTWANTADMKNIEHEDQ